MSNEFQISEPAKTENVKEPEIPAQKKIQHIADEAANKAAKTENKYDKENGNLFTR
jgi:hypothetical protein